MFKKTLATALLVCSIPALASASWFLKTQATSAGGTLDSRNQTGQTVLDGPKFASYTSASTNFAVKVTAKTGYSLSSLLVNGVQQVFPNDSLPNPYTVNLAGSAADKSVVATFLPQMESVTATNAYGTVSPSSLGGISFNYKLTAPLTFVFTPSAGYKITDITGVPADYTDPVKKDSKGNPIVYKVVKSTPGGVNQKATVTLPAGYVFTGDVNMAAVGAVGVSYLPQLAPVTYVAGSSAKTITGPSVVVPTGSSVTYSYKWTYVSGPNNTASYTGGKLTSTNDPSSFTPGPAVSGFDANNEKAAQAFSFTAPAAPANGTNLGQYKFKLTATGSDSSTLTSLVVLNVVGAIKNSAVNQCQFCHSANHVGATFNPAPAPNGTWTDVVYSNWSSSIHHDKNVSCVRCHANANAGGHPGTVSCSPCHTNGATGVNAAGFETLCKTCHTSNNNTHAVQAGVTATKGCIDCHSVAAPQHTGGVADNNNGVRAVVGEFSKWSHHVTGTNLQDAHCAACHLEGTVSGGKIVVDPAKHMADNKVHLRNAHDDSDMQWDPAAPNHTTMDNFCMSCHSAAGATSTGSQAIQGIIVPAAGKTASALNPFGDTISNRYDKMQRPRVTNVDDQFNTSNFSHHGVKGARYTGRTRNAADPNGRVVASTFANNSSALLQGVRSTIYDAGNFNALYVPLGTNGTAATGLGDDSTLHCGDCHTVGQWKPGTAQAFKVDATGATVVDNTVTTPAIGAHGSNNEYMLRNFSGTDERHTQNAYVVDPTTNVVTAVNPNGAFLVCYNCHTYNKYGSAFVGTGVDGGNAANSQMANIQPHAGEYASEGRCNGPGNTLSFAGYTTGTATDGSQFESRIDGLGAKLAGERSPDFGNVFGIQCLNCHNSGIGNAYGGIHGSANDTDWNGTTPDQILALNSVSRAGNGYYIDGMGNVNKAQRFLPGLGNAMHVPGTLGGITGGSTGKFINHSTASSGTYTTNGVAADTNWEQKHWQQKSGTVINYKTLAVSGTKSAGAGCYTLGEGKPLSGDVTVGLEGPSVTGGDVNGVGPATEAVGIWGGCDDHTAGQGQGNHGFLKRIVRPVTY